MIEKRPELTSRPSARVIGTALGKVVISSNLQQGVAKVMRLSNPYEISLHSTKNSRDFLAVSSVYPPKKLPNLVFEPNGVKDYYK